MIQKFPLNKWLDAAAYIGQRSERYHFRQYRNGKYIQNLNPSKETPPIIRHNTEASIKRQLELTLLDRDQIQSLDLYQDRIRVYAEIGGVQYPLGVYMFVIPSLSVRSLFNVGTYTLYDEGFILSHPAYVSWSFHDMNITQIFQIIVEHSGLEHKIGSSPYSGYGTFPIGNFTTETLKAFELQGGYYPWWIDHNGVFRVVRVFDQDDVVPDYNFDVNKFILRDSVITGNTMLEAPNRYIVTGQRQIVPDEEDEIVDIEMVTAREEILVATYDIPDNLPYSIKNRGFIIPEIQQTQLDDFSQIQEIARNLAMRASIVETLEFDTLVDPRYDSYNVVRFENRNWIEYEWSMSLRPGESMRHKARRVEPP